MIEKVDSQNIIHQIPPVWDSESEVLILGTMPSPKSREAGFFYMHPQNRFWKVLPAVFGEALCCPNNSPDREAAILERRDFLLRHHIALWDVLASCQISGAADSSIKNARPNNFEQILGHSKIKRVFCTGKTAWSLWEKTCAEKYEEPYQLTVECLPSTSPANAACSLEKLIEAYKVILIH
jgi:hypoxanthine-DNA glycosylase